MELITTILNQIIKMFLLMSIGSFLFYKKWIDDKGSQQISTILLKVCSVAIIVVSFNIQFTYIKLYELFLSFLVGSLSIIIGIIIARLIFKDKNKLEQLAIIFSNGGFIGIPLVQSIMGIEYIFYLSAWLLAFYVFAWTIGVYLASENKELISFKSILFSPVIIGLFLGLILFISPFKLHIVLLDTLTMLGNMNTPLAMIVLGAYVAKSDISKILLNKKAYIVSFIRLVIVPLITIFIFHFIPVSFEIKKVSVIATSAPVAVLVAMFAQQYDKDFEGCAQIVSLSTILCIITIPIMLLIAEIIL